MNKSPERIPNSAEGRDNIEMPELPIRVPPPEQQRHEGMKRVEVAVGAENMAWLGRSLVGTTLNPVDIQSLRKIILMNLPHVVDIRELGVAKVLITFDTVQHAEGVFTFKLDTLLQFFHRVRKWEVSERCISRRVWLECYGIPLHVWTPETFKAIGGQWGDVIQCGVQTGEGASFRVGRVQVDTEELDVIRERVHLTVGNEGFTIIVNEVSVEEGGKTGTLESHVVYAENGDEGHDDNRMKQVAVQADPAAELIPGEVNQVNMGEDRIVNTKVLLNDITVEYLNVQTPRLVTDVGSCTENHGEAISQGFGGCDEGVSDKTVTLGYGNGGGGVPDGNALNGGIMLGGPDQLGQRGDNILGGVSWGLDPSSPIPMQCDAGPRELTEMRLGRGRKNGPQVCGPQVGGNVDKGVTRDPSVVEAGRESGSRVRAVSHACWFGAQGCEGSEAATALVGVSRSGRLMQMGENLSTGAGPVMPDDLHGADMASVVTGGQPGLGVGEGMQEGVRAVDEGLVPVQVVWVEVPSMGAGPVAPDGMQGDAMDLAGTGVPAEIGVGEGIREEVCVFEEGLVPVPVNWAAGTVDDGRALGSLPGMLDRGRGKEVAMAGN
ncbi:hypothetical protein AHAS_Ahas13G0425800 [Arachis hypogaea]